MLSGSDAEHFCPYFRGKAFSALPLNMMLTVGLLSGVHALDQNEEVVIYS